MKPSQILNQKYSLRLPGLSTPNHIQVQSLTVRDKNDISNLRGTLHKEKAGNKIMWIYYVHLSLVNTYIENIIYLTSEATYTKAPIMSSLSKCAQEKYSKILSQSACYLTPDEWYHITYSICVTWLSLIGSTDPSFMLKG